MKRILLTIAALAALLVPAAANEEPQNNLFLELGQNRVYYHGEFLILEDLQELIKAQATPVDNVIVTTDAYSSAIMMLGIRDCVAEVSQAQVRFIFPQKTEYRGAIMSDTIRVFTLDPPPFTEPLTNKEYYTEQALWKFNEPMPEETMGVTVLLDSLDNAFYMNGKKVHYSVPINYLLEEFKLPAEVEDVETPYLRVKITDNTTVGDLICYDNTITWYAVNKNLQVKHAFFSPDTRVAAAAAFLRNPATLDDLDIATVNYADSTNYSVAPTYYDHSDWEDIQRQIFFNLPGSTGHDRGRVVVTFTVGIDGAVKEIVPVRGMSKARGRVVSALKSAHPLWSQALDNNGNPVNMRFIIDVSLQ
ncbi:MAG: hypothetical protein J6X25_08920 [Bacteroidales bacterium]|nr:hypothetical protein [Bacteroidales bacterium]